jgi:hypothetical protein
MDSIPVKALGSDRKYVLVWIFGSSSSLAAQEAKLERVECVLSITQCCVVFYDEFFQPGYQFDASEVVEVCFVSRKDVN